jgi:crotonobetainyl-CoA:carnitine CoA-transferase CaiB-like acyl-CoA transferase
MKLLAGHVVVAVDEAVRSPLARLFGTMGARIVPATLGEVPERLDEASFLIERLGTQRLCAGGCTREMFESRHPRLIHVSVTTFGSNGPRADWVGSELVASAMGGSLVLTGEPDGVPVKEALDACFFHADMVAAAGAMAAHYERGTSGLGQHIDISVQEVALSRGINGILVWQFDRRKLRRAGGALNYGQAKVRCVWSLADGWCFHTLMTGRIGAPANQALSDWIDASGLENPLRAVDWIRYNRSTLDPELRTRWEAAIAAFFRTRSKAEIATEGRRRGINATVVCEPADILADPHLNAREFWEHEGNTRVPSRFFAATQGTSLGEAAGSRVYPSPQPAPGVAPTAALAPGAGPTTASAPASAAVNTTQRPGPLAGIRVLDFSWALVGSITTKTLGDLGADVIKVESRTRPCLSRLDVQVTASRPGNFDDKPWFAHLNTSKRSLALDMKQPESREVLEPLIRWADVVVENFSPGTMAKLGLDYAALSRINPAIVMLSGSVYGQTGPLAHEWGVDGTGGALSGRTFLTGWPDRDPVIPGAVPYGDVIVPYVMAAAGAAALQHRSMTGGGCHIDASMYEICVQQTYDAILQAQTGERPWRTGNRDAGVFHQGVYPVLGEDRWIAISCATPGQWQRLVEIAGIHDSSDPAVRDTRLVVWTTSKRAPELAKQLQAAGIAAGELQDMEDLLEHDPQLKTRAPLVTLEHPLLGPFGHVRTPVRFSRSPVVPYRAPGIGEHSASIATELAGLSPERVNELEKLGVFQ